jgi:hypothetical protein
MMKQRRSNERAGGENGILIARIGVLKPSEGCK